MMHTIFQTGDVRVWHDDANAIGFENGKKKKKKNRDEEIPKLKPYVAIRALFTRIIPTDVTTLNIHEAASREAFLSALLGEDMLNRNFQYLN